MIHTLFVAFCVMSLRYLWWHNGKTGTARAIKKKRFLFSSIHNSSRMKRNNMKWMSWNQSEERGEVWYQEKLEIPQRVLIEFWRGIFKCYSLLCVAQYSWLISFVSDTVKQRGRNDKWLRESTAGKLMIRVMITTYVVLQPVKQFNSLVKVENFMRNSIVDDAYN